MQQETLTIRRAAFAELYRSHLEAIVNYSARRTSHADAVDIAAETFTVAWRRFDDIPSGAERPWLYGVARRTMANHRRSQGRRTALHDKLMSEWTVGSLGVAGNASQLRAEELEPLRQALAELGEDDRDILMLAGVEELQPSEIAMVLDVSPEVARNRLSRARKRLRSRLPEAQHKELS